MKQPPNSNFMNLTFPLLEFGPDMAAIGQSIFNSLNPPRRRRRPSTKNENPAVLSVYEFASMAGISRSTAIRILERETGVIKLTRPEKLHKRKYTSYRIPRPVAQRIIAKLAR